MLLPWSTWFWNAKNPVPWKSLLPDFTMPLISTPRVGTSAGLPKVPTFASSTLPKSQ